MGRCYLPKYRIEYRDNALAMGRSKPDAKSPIDGRPVCWSTPSNLKPSAKWLEGWRKAQNQSYAAGGVNHHCSVGMGMLIHVNYARIVNQRTGEQVCEVKAPMFEVV